MLTLQDRLSLRHLKPTPLWLGIAFVGVGVASTAAGLLGNTGIDRTLCLAGGFLIALGIEKVLNRRALAAARKLVSMRGPLRARVVRRNTRVSPGSAQHG